MPTDSSSSGSSLPTGPDAHSSSVRPALQALAKATSQVLRRRFRVLYLVREAYRRMLSHSNVLTAVWADLRTMLRLLLRWADRSYRRVSWTPLALIVGAMLYFVVPFDVVPDALGAVGFVDDVTVISTVVQRVRHELDRFRDWEDDRLLPE
ncbi:MAG: YkvA family protein [Salinibacter sp.]